MIKRDGHLRAQGKITSLLLCSQMSGVFYHNAEYTAVAENNKRRFFYVLDSDKTWVFDQSEHTVSYLYY